MAIAPSFINTPAFNGKAPNLLFSDVYQGALALPWLTINNNNISPGILYLNQSGYTFPQRITKINRYDYTPYNAGTAGVYSLGFGAITPVVGKVYHWQIIAGSATNPYTVSGFALATTTSAADLATAVNTSMTNANGGAFYTNTVSGTTITLSEVSASTGGFSFIFLNDTASTFTTTTANVPSFGLLATVQLYKPSITSGTFDLHQFSLDTNVENFEGTSTKTQQAEVIQIWVDTGATNYTTGTSQLKQFGPYGTYWPTAYCSVAIANWANLPY